MNTTITPDVAIDLHGVSCPMNLVKVKVALAPMKQDQILEVILDDGAPINNVPRSAQKEGHQIVHTHQLEDGAWCVYIKKA